MTGRERRKLRTLLSKRRVEEANRAAANMLMRHLCSPEWKRDLAARKLEYESLDQMPDVEATEDGWVIDDAVRRRLHLHVDWQETGPASG